MENKQDLNKLIEGLKETIVSLSVEQARLRKENAMLRRRSAAHLKPDKSKSE